MVVPWHKFLVEGTVPWSLMPDHAPVPVGNPAAHPAASCYWGGGARRTGTGGVGETVGGADGLALGLADGTSVGEFDGLRDGASARL